MANKTNGKNKPNYRPVSFEDAMRLILAGALKHKSGRSRGHAVETPWRRLEDNKNPEHGWYFI